MTEIDFVVGDRVVTSRGIYGTIVSIDESADTSQVNIGSKTVTLYNNQLWSVKNRISVVCYYTDGYENYNRLVVKRLLLKVLKVFLRLRKLKFKYESKSYLFSYLC